MLGDALAARCPNIGIGSLKRWYRFLQGNARLKNIATLYSSKTLGSADRAGTLSRRRRAPDTSAPRLPSDQHTMGAASFNRGTWSVMSSKKGGHGLLLLQHALSACGHFSDVARH